MTDKGFHNGTEATPSSERGGFSVPQGRRHRRRIRSDDRSSSVRPAPFRSVLGQATPLP